MNTIDTNAIDTRVHIMGAHLGDKRVTRSEVALTMPTKVMGARHNPIPFIDTIEDVTEALIKYGLHVEAEGFLLSGENHERLIGLMHLRSEYSDYNPSIALMAAYDQTISRRIGFGANVNVCANLQMWAEMVVRTKQTTYIRDRMPNLIDKLIGRVPEMIKVQHEKFESYKLTQLTPRQGDAAITEMVRQGIVLPQQVGTVIEQWDTPKHEEFTEDGFSVWRLNNAVTEAMKPKTEGHGVIRSAIARTPKLVEFCDTLVNVFKRK